MSTPRNAFTITPELAGERLDRALARLAPGVTRGEARRLIEAGVVFIGGKRTGICSRIVRVGEQLAWDPPARTPTAPSGPPPRIVVERDDLWIIDKPAGMPVEATRAGTHGTLVEWLRHAAGTAFITHRLDAATSGLIVVARDRDTQAALNRLFADHVVRRRYLAVVAPPPEWERQVFEERLDGRTAVTHTEVVARGPLAAALRVDLETGRTRQIRRHLGMHGTPVVGETAAGERVGPRLLLHAFALSLPLAGGVAAAAAAPPDDFVAATQAIGLVLPPLDALLL